MSEEITEVEDTKQSFDYRKEREERIKNKAEKAIFSELGVKSIDEIKSIFDFVKIILRFKNISFNKFDKKIFF